MTAKRKKSERTCATQVRLEFIFFEYELVVNLLDVGKVEVRLCEKKRIVRRLVNLILRQLRRELAEKTYL